ncbi:MAG TPA: cupin domain-containing protein [Phnomibacter sp.]|nr:cupin domain-containing protein [Phnomibacter sp.]
MSQIQKLIQQYALAPHPEGGYYAETYRSATMVPTAAGMRPASTAIYFLLTKGNFSAFHRIKSDEGWHHYTGDKVQVHVIHPNGNYECICLGKNIEQGEQVQAMVQAGSWFASETIGPTGFALVGCTVAPGFDFADFELANRAELQQEFLLHADLIARLTR